MEQAVALVSGSDLKAYRPTLGGCHARHPTANPDTSIVRNRVNPSSWTRLVPGFDA